MADVTSDIITRALRKINQIAPDETPGTTDLNSGLTELNDLLDTWAAKRRFAYNVSFTAYTLTPNLSPHTIGPTGTFVVAQRPVKVVGATLILTNVTPNIDSPVLRIRDDDWWNAQAVKSLASQTPTDLYYSPDFPNGSLYFWPVPNFAWGVRLELWGLISQFASLSTAFSMPPGYRNAITLSLAERLAESFGKTVTPVLMRDAQLARTAIEGNNNTSPRISTKDSGMGSGRAGRRPTFNYYSGQ
jgi:hypothetical protein